MSDAVVPTYSPDAESKGDHGTEVTLPRQLLSKHPLQNRWALWYLKADRQKEWEDCLKMVSIFDTVEDFWALFNHIQMASGLQMGSDYCLFKEGFKPMWEDDNNKEGGRWVMYIEKQSQKRHQVLDQYWLELIMAVVGEQFEGLGDQICGVICSVRRKGDKVALWTKDASRDDINLRIGNILKAKLDLPDSEQLKYEVHNDIQSRTGSSVKPRLTIGGKVEAKTSPVKE